MFYSLNGSVITVNCEVVPNTDVSGVGVRGALYLQAGITIILSCYAKRPEEVQYTNLALQATSMAVIAATFFDPTVDVAHSLVASMFSVLFSSCRFTSYDLSTSFLRS